MDVFYQLLICIHLDKKLEHVYTIFIILYFSLRINALLKEIQHDEMKEIKIALPDYEMGDENYFATFVIKNITIANAHIKLKSHRLCDCKPFKRIRRLSVQETVLECRHKDMLKLTLSEELIEVFTYIIYNF